MKPLSRPEIFIGIPTWNSELFLETCLRAIKKTTSGLCVQILVNDNDSRDRTAQIARDYGCRVIVKAQSLPDALNQLVTQSRARFSLFIHADTVLLSSNWFDTCRQKLKENYVLVSPQDIGCGPFTRPWGVGKPESSFMFFRTEGLLNLRQWRWVRRFRMPYPQRVVDFYSPNVTHFLPDRLRGRGMDWQMMRVLMSPVSKSPIWKPSFTPVCWSEELSHLKYGLGNFYAIDGEITHYHNWFERIIRDVPVESEESDLKQGGIPLAYISAYTKAFLHDYSNNCVQLPNPNVPERVPKALAVID